MFAACASLTQAPTAGLTAGNSSSEVVLAGSGVLPPRRLPRGRRRPCAKRVRHAYETVAQSSCHASVEVFNTDFDEAGEHVLVTTVNGQPVHGECSPGPGYQPCASRFPVDVDEAGLLEVRTLAATPVPGATFVGDRVHARHSLSCVRQEYARSGASRRAAVAVSGLTGGCDLRARSSTADLGIPMGCMGIRRPSAAACRRFYTHGPAQRAEQLKLCYYDAAADMCRGASYDQCRAPQSCLLSVSVRMGGFEAPRKFVRATHANGRRVHGRCEAAASRADAAGYVPCATSVPVSPDDAGVLELATEASEALDGPLHDGSLLHVKHTLVCTQVGVARSGDAPSEARYTFGGLGAALQCLLGVDVYQPGVAAASPLVLSTTANGAEVHSRCTLPRTVVRADGWFACARRVPLAPSPTGRYLFVTNASCAVDENPHDGHELHVQYRLECGG